MTLPTAQGRGIPASPKPAGVGRTRPGLTASPQADTVSPTAKMFCAAFTSRSWTAATFRAGPLSDIQCQGVEHMATGRAAFATGIPLVNADQGTPIPGGFVLQLAHELAPADIVNGFRQRRMLRPSPSPANSRCKSFGSHESGVSRVCAGSQCDGQQCGHGYGPPCGAPCRGSWSRVASWPDGAALAPASVSSWAKKRGLPTFSPLSSTTTSCRPRSMPTCAVDRRQWRNLFFDQDADEVASGGITAHRDRGGLCAIGQRPRPVDVQRGRPSWPA